MVLFCLQNLTSNLMCYISARADVISLKLLFTDVETNSSRAYFQESKEISLVITRIGILMRIRILISGVSLRISTTSFDYSPVPKELWNQKEQWHYNRTFYYPCQWRVLYSSEWGNSMSIDWFTICNSRNNDWPGQNQHFRTWPIYCNEDNLIPLVGKGSPFRR